MGERPGQGRRLLVPRPRHKNGNRSDDLLDALVAAHGEALMSFAFRITGDRHLAEDIVQETLMRAWRHPEALDGTNGSPRGWLFTVARRLAVDGWRRDSRRRSIEHDQADLARADTGLPQHLDRVVDDWMVSAALDSLSPEHREALVQTIWLDRSVKDAAEVIGIPPGTLKSRTYYALRAVRLSLEEMGYFS
jgi:RNA polymerase sigma-70 factor (ECF subfamily)